MWIVNARSCGLDRTIWTWDTVVAFSMYTSLSKIRTLSAGSVPRKIRRVSVPDETIARMAAQTSKEAAFAEGVAIAREMVAAVRGEVQGVQVSAPFGKYIAAAQVLGLV